MDKDEFLSKQSDEPLKITCYGSSSSATPVEYLAEAEMLGRALALRGHTCVNGAGSAGCMAAMNDGASDEGGDIVGVIHEMFVVDGSDWTTEEGGAHSAFHGGKRTILVASGNDLRERKRLLVENADALVVLPGGPGTFDEVRENNDRCNSSSYFSSAFAHIIIEFIEPCQICRFRTSALGDGLCKELGLQ